MLTEANRVTALNFGNNDEEILVGYVEPVVKVYESQLKSFTGNHTFEHGPIVGLTKFNGTIVSGMANGKIQIDHKKPTFLETGDVMSRMRQCAVERKLIASGGQKQQNNLKVWNLESNQCVFRTKHWIMILDLLIPIEPSVHFFHRPSTYALDRACRLSTIGPV